MEITKNIRKNMEERAYDKILAYLNPGQDSLTGVRERYSNALDAFEEIFGKDREAALYSTPGRTEIGGNHTDHQHGCVVAASVNLDIIAVASINQDNKIRILSQGYPMDEVSLGDLIPNEAEKNTSISLIRGVAAGLKERGFEIGGFDAYLTSNVLQGSGLSSSAAYEVMLATLLSGLFNQGNIDRVVLAQVGQYAENKYFGKPCGLLDQTACSVGGFVAIDFYNPEKPVVEKIDFDFASCGHTLCIVDTGGSHADLTSEYASIPPEMQSVARCFGKEVLRDVPAGDFYENMASIRGKVSDRALLRAHHFFMDSQKAQEIAQALREKDFDRFRALSTASGRSSFMYLQNAFASSAPQEQGLSLALATAERLLNGRGSFRVHGGGFAGTIQVFVPNDMLSHFRDEMEKLTGKGSCHLLSIRPIGGIEITADFI